MMNTSIAHKNKISTFVLDDAEKVAAIHRECFLHYFSTKLGSDFCVAMYRLYAVKKEAFGFVVKRNRECLGFVVGGNSDIHHQINKMLRIKAATKMFMRPKLVFEVLCEKAQRIIKKDKAVPKSQPLSAGGKKIDRSSAAKLVLIGVKEDARGTGAAAELMQSFFEEAKIRGFNSVILTVSRDNLRARRAYEKAGWILIDKGRESVEYYIKTLGE